jgi:hypothetical protein
MFAQQRTPLSSEMQAGGDDRAFRMDDKAERPFVCGVVKFLHLPGHEPQNILALTVA